MKVRINIRTNAELTSEERATFVALCAEAYSPAESAAWPGRALEWALPDSRILVWTETGELACHAGLLIREAQWNGQALRIGGIGGVVTHPRLRKLGFASEAMRHAVAYFAAQPNIACALLACEPRLFPFYAALGWEEFCGRTLVRQRGETVEFTFNKIMTHPLALPRLTDGQLDLMGPPW